MKCQYKDLAKEANNSNSNKVANMEQTLGPTYALLYYSLSLACIKVREVSAQGGKPNFSIPNWPVNFWIYYTGDIWCSPPSQNEEKLTPVWVV